MSNDKVRIELKLEDAQLLLDYLKTRLVCNTDEEHCIPIRNAIRALRGAVGFSDGA